MIGIRRRRRKVFPPLIQVTHDINFHRKKKQYFYFSAKHFFVIFAPGSNFLPAALNEWMAPTVSMGNE